MSQERHLGFKTDARSQGRASGLRVGTSLEFAPQMPLLLTLVLALCVRKKPKEQNVEDIALFDPQTTTLDTGHVCLPKSKSCKDNQMLLPFSAALSSIIGIFHQRKVIHYLFFTIYNSNSILNSFSKLHFCFSLNSLTVNSQLFSNLLTAIMTRVWQ